MKLFKLSLGFSLATVVVSLFVTRVAIGADAFPTRPLRILVNTAPGGLTDVTTRIIAQQLAENLKQSVVVENRGGGDGLIGICTVKAANPDGYTVLSSAATIAQQMAVQKDPGYDLLKDFTGIGIMARAPYLMLTAASQPDRTVADFVKRAKRTREKLMYASAGNGTVPHFVGERFLRQAGGIKVLHIPYKGNGPAMADIVSARGNYSCGHGGAAAELESRQLLSATIRRAGSQLLDAGRRLRR